MNVSLVYITAPDADVAQTIADYLVEHKLAACVGFLPGLKSTYRWEGKVEHTEECVMFLKTATDKVDILINAVKKMHPYEVPCILAMPVAAGFPAFIQWIQEETKNAVL